MRGLVLSEPLKHDRSGRSLDIHYIVSRYIEAVVQLPSFLYLLYFCRRRFVKLNTEARDNDGLTMPGKTVREENRV